jgi:hypothetical protein
MPVTSRAGPATSGNAWNEGCTAYPGWMPSISIRPAANHTWLASETASHSRTTGRPAFYQAGVAPATFTTFAKPAERNGSQALQLRATERQLTWSGSSLAAALRAITAEKGDRMHSAKVEARPVRNLFSAGMYSVKESGTFTRGTKSESGWPGDVSGPSGGLEGDAGLTSRYGFKARVSGPTGQRPAPGQPERSRRRRPRWPGGASRWLPQPGRRSTG